MHGLDNDKFNERRLLNLVQSVLLIGAMSLILALSAEFLLGDGVWPFVFAGVILSLVVAPSVSPRWILQMYQARPLAPGQAGRLHVLLERIADRAGLEAVPTLYWIPSNALNAFTVGSRGDAAIALTHGLLDRLTLREIAGVLAHESSHIANNDMRIMGLADAVSRLTHFLAMFGLLLAFVSLPLVLFGVAPVSPLGILLLLLAPTVSALLQLALSRTREFLADMEAVRITGDPEGLAGALYKLEYQGAGYWQRLFNPVLRDPNPSVLRTHPATAQRIERLLSLKREAPARRLHVEGVSPVDDLPTGFGVGREPRIRWFSNTWR